MPEWALFVQAAALAGIVMIQEFISVGFLPVSIQYRQVSRRWQWSCAALRAGWMMAGIFWGPPLPVFLLGVAPVYLLSVYPYLEERYRVHLSCVVHFLIFTSTILLSTGLLALLEQRSIQSIFAGRSYRAWILCAGNLAVCMSLLFLRMGRMDILDLEHERKQDNLFFMFLWCCILYVYTDAFFCLFAAKGDVIAVLLITGNLLLLLLIFLFFQQKWKIAANKILEDEHEQLAAARAQEQIKKAQLQNIMEREALTGCYTRRYIMSRIQELVELHARFTAVFIDINRLKETNDRYGHDAGDELLKSFARQMESRLRGSDQIARIGGDEFLIILQGCSDADARRRMQEIRLSMGDPDNPQGSVSFSFGIAQGEGEPQSIVEKADQAMYEDKKRIKAVQSDV